MCSRLSRVGRRFSSAALRQLPEVRSASEFASRLDAALETAPAPADAEFLSENAAAVNLALDAAMATTALHTQSRIAAFEGYGYYTIGPCGEELLSSLALALRPTDPVALHYRHLSTLLARQLDEGGR